MEIELPQTITRLQEGLEEKNKSIAEINVEQYNNLKEDCWFCHCPKCKDKGYIAYINDMGMMGLKKCTCYNVRMNRARMLELDLYDGIKRFNGRIENLPEDEEWEKVVKLKLTEYLKQETPSWFWFGGQTGIGKTSKMALVVYLLNSRYNNISVDYINWDTDWRNIAFKYDQAEKQKIIEGYQNVDLLYIDDLFRHPEKITDSEIDFAKAIIDSRYRKHKVTLISSELTLNDLAKIDEAIYGRIVERCNHKYFINVKKDPNKNYRLKETQEEL
jgi:DNA replication protein DnaC